MPLDDAALLRALLAKDERVFASIVDGWYGSMLRVADVFAKNRSVAEEIVQETWLAVLDGLKDFEGRSRLKTWVFRILTRRAITRAEREGRTTPFSSLETESPGDAPDSSRFDVAGNWTEPPKPWTERPSEDLLLRKEIRLCVEKELELLPPAQRGVVVLRDIEDCDAAEVCEILGVSEANQRVLLHRGRLRLRAAMERYIDETSVKQDGPKKDGVS